MSETLTTKALRVFHKLAERFHLTTDQRKHFIFNWFNDHFEEIGAFYQVKKSDLELGGTDYRIHIKETLYHTLAEQLKNNNIGEISEIEHAVDYSDIHDVEFRLRIFVMK